MKLDDLLKVFSSINYPTLIIGAVVGGIISTFIKMWFEERARSFRMKRLIVGPGSMPRFNLVLKQQNIELEMIGDYSVINFSELPVHLKFPKASLQGYNRANRAFQFKVTSRNTEPDLKKSLELLFKEVPLPSRSETVLISASACQVIIERFDVRSLPAFLWLETFEQYRLGPKEKYRTRAFLYCRGSVSKSKGVLVTTYYPSGREISSFYARLLALPGKLLYRRRMRKLSKKQKLTNP